MECRGLGKAYGGRWVVDNLWLGVPRGSLFGMVGPNGAGKTTTLSMVTGLLRPSAGRARVLDIDPWTEPLKAKARIGIAQDGLQLFDLLSGGELLRYVGALRGMPADLVAQRTAELFHVLELQDAAYKAVADYSAGMTKKISLACALIHGPDLLVLDALRGGRPGLRSGDPHHPAPVRGGRRHRRHVQPRHGTRRGVV